MESWFSFAEDLAEAGFSALPFNFRGYGASEGDGFAVDTDVVAAVDFVVSLGAERVYVVGASMGGTGAVAAAGSVTVPITLLAGQDDDGYPEEARAIGAAAAGPTDVRIVPSGAHGTNLLVDMGEGMRDLIINKVSD